MTIEMGPCPNCRRHVRPDRGACPFCAARWTLSRREFGAAAAAVAAFLAPIADAAARPQDAKPKYGVEREPPPMTKPRPAADPLGAEVYGPTDAARLPIGESWKKAKPGASITFSHSFKPWKGDESKATKTVSVAGANDETVELAIANGPEAARHSILIARLTPESTRDDKNTGPRRETLTIDGKEYACDVKVGTVSALPVTVWWCKDAPWSVARASAGNATTQLLKLKEEIAVGTSKIACSVWKTVADRREVTAWCSPEVPGLVVKVVIVIKDDQAPKGIASTETIEAKSVTEGK
jgi:hypothetical protein